VCSAWRSGLRRVLGLPNTAHCSLLSPLSCTLPLNDELFKRFVLFAQRCLSSDCYLVRYVASCSIMYNPMQSPLGKNIVLSCFHFQITIDDFMLINSKYITNYVFNQLDNDTWITVNSLLELISICSYSFYFFQITIFYYLMHIC
jgi:hypothetical protein